MIIHYLYVECIAVLEAEAHTPLIIDAHAPLAGTIAVQLFQPIGGRQSQILDSGRRVQLQKPHDCALSKLGRNTTGFARGVEALRFAVGEGLYHGEHP
jgi:hypothetical protein